MLTSKACILHMRLDKGYFSVRVIKGRFLEIKFGSLYRLSAIRIMFTVYFGVF